MTGPRTFGVDADRLRVDADALFEGRRFFAELTEVEVIPCVRVRVAADSRDVSGKDESGAMVVGD